MIADQLYLYLEKDFITEEMSDEWMHYMGPITDFLSENFKRRSMGLVCDFTTEINKVYTAVFPTQEVMHKILADSTKDAMLFVHHPSIWDIRKAPVIFQPMDRALLQQFSDMRISIYNLHVPLDNFGEYGTSVTLAKALSIEPVNSFAPYFGSMAGVFGRTALLTISDLRKVFAQAVAHEVSLYSYGSDKIKSGIVAIVAGGGLDETIEEIAENKVNVLITGITVKNDHTQAAHEIAKANGINVLGGTHYSTEKFACRAMVRYFAQLGLPSEFIDDKPVMEDM